MGAGAGMQVAWLFGAMMLVAHSRADSEAVLPLRCYTCGSDKGGCDVEMHAGGAGAGVIDFAGRAVLCHRDQPYCATRASSPNFTSVLSCSSAVEGVCSLSHSVKGTYEMICVCSTPLCNAPFSHQMQAELINYTTFEPATNSNQLNKIFWKLSHLTNASDANIYNKITEKIRGVTEVPPRREGPKWKTTRTIAASTMRPGGNPQWHVVPKEMRSVESDRQAEAMHHIVQKVEEPRSQVLRQAKVQMLIGEQQAEEPRVQAVRQLPPTAAPSDDDDDEDEGEGSGADDEAPGRRSPPAVPAAAAPNSYLPADENSAPPLFFNFFLISSLLLYMIV